ncbi:MAG: type IV secretory system conjugative DNA transfer family protein, partial [archaeon]|nr:type IV secretory system conjugative DNA transfer family protein [archaeon]
MKDDNVYKRSDGKENPKKTLRPRWCRKKEFFRNLFPFDIKDKDAVGTRGGPVLYSDRGTAMVDCSDNHTAVLSATGSRKSLTVVAPSIWATACTGDSMVVFDCKGELLKLTGRTLRSKGYRILNLGLRDPKGSEGWNPLIMPFRMYHGIGTDMDRGG